MEIPSKQDQKELSLFEYLTKYRKYYNSRCELLENPTPNQIRERFVFSVFTVHRQFKISKKIFLKFKDNPNPERIQERTILKSRCGLYTQAKNGLRSWKRVKQLLNNPDNMFNDKNIKGISLAKLNFFLALIKPKDYYFCLDTHMLQFLGINKDKLTSKVYERVRGEFSRKAFLLGYFPFALQWGIWEYKQKRGEIDHGFLWSK